MGPLRFTDPNKATAKDSRSQVERYPVTGQRLEGSRLVRGQPLTAAWPDRLIRYGDNSD